jgi:hypothetical protein
MWYIEKIVSNGDYNRCVVKDHPNRTKVGSYVLHHRIVMENHLGRLLNKDEVVHHINGDKKDNRIENLELMDFKKHTKMHRTIGKKMVTLKCPECKIIFDRERRQTFLIKKKFNFTFCSRVCGSKFSNKYKTDDIPYIQKGSIIKEYTLLV